MLEIAGEHLQYLAFHNMFRPGGEDSPLKGTDYRKDPARTWEHLMGAFEVPEAKLLRVREETDGSGVPLAVTECHFALPGRNRCEVLLSWAAGVANARVLNVHERNGDVLKIATLADFLGTRWQVNAIMVPTPSGRPYMMPVARVMCLYRKHSGQSALEVPLAPSGLDVTASRTDGRVFVHVVNTNRSRTVSAQIQVKGATIASGRVFEIAEPPELEIIDTCPDAMAPVEKRLPKNARWIFPPASVSAVELDVDG
jgi:hypothetical protein